MEKRVDARAVAPEILQAATKLQEAIESAGLDERLGELVKIRASIINGCAFCINMHTRDARKLGESEGRIFLLAAWRESTVFDPRERAVLAWTDALTRVADHGAPPELYAELKQHFDDKQIVALTWAISIINLWNRFAIGFASVHPAERSLRAQTS